MANIINFQQYINSKEEEKRRIKQIFALSAMSKNIEELLYNINDSMGCSLLTKHFGEMNQIVGKEKILNPNIINVIVESLNAYYSDICQQIEKLNNSSITTITSC